jgi:Transposase DDE domain group 1
MAKKRYRVHRLIRMADIDGGAVRRVVVPAELLDDLAHRLAAEAVQDPLAAALRDAARLRQDPAMRWIVGGKAAQGCAASPSQMGRFETQWLAAPENFSALADLSGQWIDLVHGRRPPRGIVLDMDSSVSPTHGEQEMSASGTAITPAPAIIRCSCSISSVIWNAALCAPATCTAPMAGMVCSSRS